MDYFFVTYIFFVTANNTVMGLGFRLNIKWAFPLHSHFPSSTPSKLFSASSSFSVKERYFNSPRLSFLSVISEESKSFCKDPIKACTFSSATPQISEDALSQREDIQVASGLKRYVSNPDSNVPNGTHFSLLMQNLGVLEESFSNSDVLRLEREILLQLGRLGALNLFNSRLLRTLEASSFLDLSSIATDYVEEHEKPRETDEKPSRKVVRSGKSEERKSRKRKPANPSCVSSKSLISETVWLGLQQPNASSVRRAVKSRSRRLSVTKNEADMATAVKMVVKLERIRTALEKETGAVVSLSCWAQAAGLDEKVLQRHLSFGWHCRDELIRSNKSLLLYLARNYRGLGIALDDLLQAGKFGVLQGAERFDQSRGYRFSTYVHYWIRKSMSRLVARHSRGILIPASLSKAINQIQKVRREVNNGQRRYPDEDEIVTLSGLSLDKVRLASNCPRVVGSVDHKISNSFSGKHVEFMPDVLIKNPEENIMRQHMRKDIHNLLSVLDSRERQVLILRYGLMNEVPKSLKEIGKLFQVSKEWIRKIEKKALRKLRDEEARGDLSHYLNL